MVNAVLGSMIYMANSRRRMMFSSFDPDVCAALRLRQQRIPVRSNPPVPCMCLFIRCQMLPTWGTRCAHPGLLLTRTGGAPRTYKIRRHYLLHRRYTGALADFTFFTLIVHVKHACARTSYQGTARQTRQASRLLRQSTRCSDPTTCP